MIKAVFFDLFFTLIYPGYSDINEYDVIGISAMEWEKYAEDNVLYCERASGKVRTENDIINRIVDIMPYHVNMRQKQEILQRREERIKRALLSVDSTIIDTLRKLKEKGVKRCRNCNKNVKLIYMDDLLKI